MARDEARILERGERALRRGDVGDDHVRARCVEHLPHDGWSRADRNGDDDELRVRDRLGERRRRLDTRRAHAAPSSTPESASKPRHRVPARPAASAIDVPMRPVPTTARRSTARGRSATVAGRRRCAPVGRDLLLQHVEHGGEDRPSRLAPRAARGSPRRAPAGAPPRARGRSSARRPRPCSRGRKPRARAAGSAARAVAGRARRSRSGVPRARSCGVPLSRPRRRRPAGWPAAPAGRPSPGRTQQDGL